MRRRRGNLKIGDLVLYQPYGWEEEGITPGVVVKMRKTGPRYLVVWAKHPGKSNWYEEGQLVIVTAHKYQT